MSDPSPEAAGAPREARPRATFIMGLAGALVALLMVGGGAWFWLSGEDGPMTIGGPFVLVDGDGRTVTERSFRGKYMLVYFGFTWCPDVCPTTLGQVADALDRLGPEAERVVPVLISLDPKRDTPKAMKEYAAALHPRLVGLTGTPEQTAAAARAYRVYWAEKRTGPGEGDYTLDHSSILYLMGPDGRFISPINASASGEQMAAELRRLMK